MSRYDDWLFRQADLYNAGCGQQIFIGKDEDGINQYVSQCEVCDNVECENNPRYVNWLEEGTSSWEGL